MIYAQGAVLSFGGMTKIIPDDPDANVQWNYLGWMHPEKYFFIPYVEKYDPDTETWSHIEDMQFGRNFPGLALISERRFYFGCLAPPTAQYGSFECPTYPEINEEKKCTLKCDAGYAPDGIITSICSAGSWAPSLADMKCSPIVDQQISKLAFHIQTLAPQLENVLACIGIISIICFVYTRSTAKYEFQPVAGDEL